MSDEEYARKLQYQYDAEIAQQLAEQLSGGTVPAASDVPTNPEDDEATAKSLQAALEIEAREVAEIEFEVNTALVNEKREKEAAERASRGSTGIKKK
eukprot:CAMPEP_0196657204 /NCGR_PEP_ID=MMETSP1086-20130531/22505_1 /TAXON_ID=77921 /ORGANISM="Cyanoptyche  gloeocystis , Strain SAG4.97" /LENGTH=96 /DNA_ID=CAMNT_0041990249 /DNA_START=43 /DNA_END=333 /DNA_ORIENTATION=-